MPELKSSLEKLLEEYDLLKYFDVQECEDKVILISKNNLPNTPTLDEIRNKIAELNITEEDIEEAIKWARKCLNEKS